MSEQKSGLLKSMFERICALGCIQQSPGTLGGLWWTGGGVSGGHGGRSGRGAASSDARDVLGQLEHGLNSSFGTSAYMRAHTHTIHAAIPALGKFVAQAARAMLLHCGAPLHTTTQQSVVQGSTGEVQVP